MKNIDGKNVEWSLGAVYTIFCVFFRHNGGKCSLVTFAVKRMESVNSIGSPEENSDISDEVRPIAAFHS